jgi:hypothetical protein
MAMGSFEQPGSQPAPLGVGHDSMFGLATEPQVYSQANGQYPVFAANVAHLNQPRPYGWGPMGSPNEYIDPSHAPFHDVGGMDQNWGNGC